VNGLDAWAKKKGIAGRGILVDYADYAGIEMGSNMTRPKRIRISVEVVKTILAETKTEVHIGDNLLLRTGLSGRHPAPESKKERRSHEDERQWPGMMQSQTTTEWLWRASLLQSLLIILL